jgi:hypothetical protein
LPAVSLPHVKILAPQLPFMRDPKRILATAQGQTALLAQWLADGARHVAVSTKSLTATLQREVRRLNTNTRDVVVAQVVGRRLSHTTIATVTNRLSLWYEVQIDAPAGLVSSAALPFTYARLLSPKERLLLQLGPTNGVQAIALRLDPTTPKALLLDALTLGCELPSLLSRQEKVLLWLRAVMPVGRFTCAVVQGTIAMDADPGQAAIGLASISQALGSDPHLAKFAHVVSTMQAMTAQPSLGATASTTICSARCRMGRRKKASRLSCGAAPPFARLLAA